MNNQYEEFYFKDENTQDFNEETLNKMNSELEEKLTFLNVDSDFPDYDLIDHAVHKIFNKYC